MATAEHLYTFALTATFILFLSRMHRFFRPRRSDPLSGEHTVEQSNNAFEGIAPPSTSASKSEPKKAPFEVFINHRGTDTKQTLASSIYDTLHEMRVKVFLDKEVLEVGDVIPAEIEEAMRTSFLHIAILSPHYAESPWCLAELSFMLKTGRTVIPVFYDVDPADVRYAKGPFAAAFAEHERKKRCSPEKLKDWKEALHEVSFHSGQIVKGNEDDKRLLKIIVNCVMKHMKKELKVEVAKHPVGLGETANDFESILDASKKIQIVGIVGLGGCGKTTLAKEIYNRKSPSIEKSSFLFDIRDAASKKELYKKQKKLMQDIGDNRFQFDNVEEGKAILKSCSRFLKVLLVLDDVDNLEQLNALLPDIDTFAQGSLIIVTSREVGVLKSWGISSIYQMKGLHLDHARELLCWHAFLNPSPPDEFQDLVEKFVQFCNGLPLSLQVFGGLLYHKSKEYWKSQLDKASRLLPNDIKGRLKISFDTLDEEEKEVFLDIACFFIGEEKSLAVAVWDGSGWSGLHSLEVLENKCLVDVDKYNKIKMHDQLRDLGREIAKGWSSLRIWSSQQITDIQKQNTERVLIRGIRAETDDFYEESPSYDGTPFKECMELLKGCPTKSKALTPSILVVEGDYFTEELATLFPALLWLRWSNMPGTALPSWLILKSLRVLELPDTSFLKEMWNDTADRPLELRELNLTHARNFLSFPRSIKRLEHLKKISLTGAWRFPMGSLPEEFCQLGSLEYLQLSRCGELTSLPCNLGNLTNLRHLDLSDCWNLRVLPDSFKQLRNLKHINFNGCKELTLTSENEYILEYVTNLETLDFSGCEKLQKLPQHITNQLSLRYLDVSDTGLRELPINTGELSKLEKLSIGSEFLTSLPESIGNLSCLRSLNISRMLGTLPDSIGNLSCLRSLNISRMLGTLPDSIGNLSSLTSLHIHSCEQLGTLPESIGNLSSLTSLHISSCGQLGTLPESMGNLSSLTSLHISFCRQLGTLPESMGNLSSLTSLDISFCRQLGTLPESVGNLSSLSQLRICVCDELIAIPESVSHLSSLKDVGIRSCPKLGSVILEPFRSLNRLEEPSIKSTVEKPLPKTNAQLAKIESLDIWKCPITELILLSGSFSSSFWNLKTLNLSNTPVSRISISQQCCPSLEFLYLSGNEQLVEITTLPISVKDLTLKDSRELEDLDVLSGMVNLERLSILDCGGKLYELPSFANLLLLKEFKFFDHDDQPLKIQGLENCRSLEKVTAVTCWNVPDIQNLEHVVGLQRLFLSAACNISAFEPCLKTIKKWPSECIICARRERGVESVMSSFVFPGLTLVDSCVEKIDEDGFGELSLEGGQRRRSNQAAMVCFNTNSTSASTRLDFRFHDDDLVVGEGKWVWLGVFTEASRMREKCTLRVRDWRSSCVELGRGELVIGEEEKVVEAFKQMTVTLGECE